MHHVGGDVLGTSSMEIIMVARSGFPLGKCRGNQQLAGYFMTISPFLIQKGWVSSSKITLVGTELNLREKMKIYPEVLTIFINLKFANFKLLLYGRRQRN